MPPKFIAYASGKRKKVQAAGKTTSKKRQETRHESQKERNDMRNVDSDDSENEFYDTNIDKTNGGFDETAFGNEMRDDDRHGVDDVVLNVTDRRQEDAAVYEGYESNESENEQDNSEGDNVGEGDRSKRQMQLVRVYSQNIKLLKNESTLRTLSKSLRKCIILHV